MAEAVGAVRIDLSADWAALQSDLGKAQSALTQFAGRAANLVGQGIRTGFSAANSAGGTLIAGLIGQQAIQAASDAQQMQGAFDAAFGDMADNANQWAARFAQVNGRFVSDVQEQATTFHNLFQEILPTNEAATEASERFTQLTADFASLKNIQPDRALSLVRSALTGSARALQQYGVNLSTAHVRQVALAAGIITTKQNLSQEQATLVRAQIISQALASASGNLADSQNEAANAAIRVKAEFQAQQVQIGNKLIPVMLTLSRIINGLIGAFNGMGTALGNAILSGIRSSPQLVARLYQVNAALHGQATNYADVLDATNAASAASHGFRDATVTATTANQHAATAATDTELAYLNLAHQLDNQTLKGGGGAHERGKTLQEELALLERERTSLSLNTQSRDVEADVLTRVNQLRHSYDQSLQGDPANQIRSAVAMNARISRFNDLIDRLQPATAAQREYTLDLAALDEGLAQGRITQDAYTASVAALGVTYRDTIDPMTEFTRQQAEQRQLLTLNSQAMDVERGVMDQLNSMQLDYAANKDGPVANAIRNELNLTAQATRSHEALQGIYQEFVQPAADYQTALEAIAQAQQQFGLSSQDATILALQAEKASLENATDAASGLRRAMIDLQLDSMNTAKQVEDAFGQTVGGLKDTLGDIATGTKSAQDAFKQYILEIVRSQFIKPFLDNLFAGIFGGGKATGGAGAFNFLGGIGNFVGGLFGGKKEGGGHVTAGMNYLVGEGGAEMFTPDTNGHISTHDETAAMGRNRGGVTFNVYTPDADSFRRSRRQMSRDERRMLGV